MGEKYIIHDERRAFKHETVNFGSHIFGDFFSDMGVAVMVESLLISLRIIDQNNVTVYHIEKYDDEKQQIKRAVPIVSHRRHALLLHMDFSQRLEAMQLVTKYCEDWQAKKDAKRK